MDSQEEKLRREILGEAEKRAGRLVDRAKNECNAALKNAEETNRKSREARLADARRKGEQKARIILNSLESEKLRLWLIEREACIDEMLEKAMRDALALEIGSPKRKKSLTVLLNEAVEALQLPAVVACAASADVPFIPERIGECIITVKESTEIRGGVVVSSPDGRLVYDNSLEGRCHRLHNDFRRILAQE